MSSLVSKVSFNVGDKIHGFRVVSIKDVEDYRSVGIRLKHDKTGADIYHLFNDDRENLFAFGFKTPPPDSSGVAHIVEHSVLSGSRRFPVKEPFVALLNSSMNTFLNAMTFPDKTVYPASSIVEKDFYNLMLVYGDAVFFPLMRKETFLQEAYHLEFGGCEGEGNAKFVGVVFNEMKGAYSDPDSLVEDLSYRSLFPDTPYGFDSGGEPWSIPDLTYEEFVDFHRRYYHPSNSRIFLYGNIPTERHLEFLDREFLSHFDRLDMELDIPFQERWEKPIVVERTYPLKEGSDTKNKSSVLVNWATVPVTDPYNLMVMEVLSEILVGNAGSPLRKRLVESGLGEDLSPLTGFTTELKQTIFSVGLRGTDRDKREAIEGVIFDTLQGLIKEGIPEDLMAAAIHRVEFRNREIRGNGSPYALKLMRKTFRGWLHGLDPEATLVFNPYIERFKSEIGKTLRIEKFLDSILVNNKHRATVVVYPDPDYRDNISILIEKKLKEKLASITDEERAKIEEENARLKELLDKPDSPEDVDKIPVVDIEDIPDEVERIPTEKFRVEDYEVYFHDIYTNGIVYVDIGFDISGLDDMLMLFIPLLGRAICKSGLKEKRYDEVAKLLAMLTGGFYSSLDTTVYVGKPTSDFSNHIFFRVKFLKSKLMDALTLVSNLITGADFFDSKHLKDILLELRNDFKGDLIPEGHLFTLLRARAGLSEPARKEELWKGLSQYVFLDALVKRVEGDISFLPVLLESLRDFMVTNRMILNVTCSREDIDDVVKGLEEIIGSRVAKSVKDIQLKEGILNIELWKIVDSIINHSPVKNILNGAGRDNTEEGKVYETFGVSSKVGFVAEALPGFRIGDTKEPSQSVLAHLLRTSYLWETVRMKGGAYGAFALNYNNEGSFVFGSYRDPNIVSTLEAYRESFSFVSKITEKQVRNSILGTIGRDDKPLDPSEKGFVGLKRYLSGVTDDIRLDRRKNIKQIDLRTLADIANELKSRLERAKVVILAGKQMIETEGGKDSNIARNVFDIPE